MSRFETQQQTKSDSSAARSVPQFDSRGFKPSSSFRNSARSTGFPKLHVRNDLHLARKIWHMGMGLIVVAVFMSGMPISTALTILGAALVWDLCMEFARLRFPLINEVLMRFWGPIMRSHEVDRMSAIPHYILASMIAMLIFPKPVAALSILYLACGDPMASLCGILYGKYGMRFRNGKSLIGTLGGIGTCAVITVILLKSMGYSDGFVLAMALLGGIAGGTAEHLPLDVDDNFTIPVVSGFVLWLGFILFGV